MYRIRSFGAIDQPGPNGYPTSCDEALTNDPSLASQFASWVSDYTTGSASDKHRVAIECNQALALQDAQKNARRAVILTGALGVFVGIGIGFVLWRT